VTGARLSGADARLGGRVPLNCDCSAMRGKVLAAPRPSRPTGQQSGQDMHYCQTTATKPTMIPSDLERSACQLRLERAYDEGKKDGKGRKNNEPRLRARHE